jgi:hypothetical protein
MTSRPPAESRHDVVTYQLTRCNRGEHGGFDCQGSVCGLACGPNFCRREYASLEQFFAEGNPERDACLRGADGSFVPIHIPCSFHPIGNVRGLSEVCADREGRLYRYDSELKALVLVFSPLSRRAPARDAAA